MKNTKVCLRSALLTLLVSLSVSSLPSHSFGSGGGKSGGVDDVGGVSSGGGGGGGGRRTTPPSPAPAPVPTTALTFSLSPAVNGVVPHCTGYYSVDPYYPTLSRFNLNLGYSSLNEAYGTQLYVTVTLVGTYYGASGVITVTAPAGNYKLSSFCSPGTTLTSVVVKDAAGKVIFSGH